MFISTSYALAASDIFLSGSVNMTLFKLGLLWNAAIYTHNMSEYV